MEINAVFYCLSVVRLGLAVELLREAVYFLLIHINNSVMRSANESFMSMSECNTERNRWFVVIS